MPSSAPISSSWPTCPPWKWKVAHGLQADRVAFVPPIDQHHGFSRGQDVALGLTAQFGERGSVPGAIVRRRRCQDQPDRDPADLRDADRDRRWRRLGDA